MRFYDENAKNWKKHIGPILSGNCSMPWNSHVYWNHPAVGSDGRLHLSFVWCTQIENNENQISNINIGYASSPDNGHSWFTSIGQVCQLPINPLNAEIVHPVLPGQNLASQCSMALDSQNRPHVVFFANDINGIPQYQHLRYDGKQWQHQVISNRKRSFDLEEDGNMQSPISRPEIVIDLQDNAYIITRGDHSHNAMVATLLPSPNYSWSNENTQIIWDDNLRYAEPIIDRERWLNDNVLSMLIQCNDMPCSDMDRKLLQSKITIVDIKFNFI